MDYYEQAARVAAQQLEDTSTLLQYQQPDEATMSHVGQFQRPAEQQLDAGQGRQ